MITPSYNIQAWLDTGHQITHGPVRYAAKTPQGSIDPPKAEPKAKRPSNSNFGWAKYWAKRRALTGG